MNKKQIQSITGKYVTFNLETPLIKLTDLNSGKLEFVTENIIKIGDMYIQTKDVKIIEGKGLR